MRINILGGGPGGLYASILLKKEFRTAEVNVYERNAPGDTFGFGVVFSDETLGGFAEADLESHQDITQNFARWDAIDVLVKGKRIRSRGHGFCGISRRKLLELFTVRATKLGVKIHFQSERMDVDALRDADLFIAADGLRSVVRTRFEEAFKPSFDARKCRYIWLGTKQPFEAFTFSFRENEDGLFQIHAYQFDAESSTVIVECDEESWKKAGLDKATEAESLAYCEKLFAADLGGHRLLSNRSSWVQFPTLKNEHWAHENMVLMGDAAHTAHFSIGSGTKLAMEDAIALVGALKKRLPRGDAAIGSSAIADALQAYEVERKPMVGRIQTAAQQSLEWFENAKRYHAAFEPEQFVFSLMTRSRRITHANLAKRDPQLVREADQWFEAKSAVAPSGRVTPPMFTPFQLGKLTLENRIVVSPMCMYSAQDGMPNDFHLVHYGSRAQGGAGLVFTEMTNVSAEGRITPGCTGIWSEAQSDAWKRIVDFVHAHSRAKFGLQLGHAGRKGSTRVAWEGSDVPLADGNWALLAPSAIPYDKNKGSQTPQAMTRDDMDRVLAEFVNGTKLAARAGFDLIELHMAHGYLLSSFITPISNHRTDAYGGSLENRMRFPLEVLDAVRAAWPNERPMSVRISAVDWAPGGLSADDAVQVARLLRDHGADIVDCSSGQTTPDARPVYGRAFQTPFSERIRNEVGIPTMAVGNVGDFDQANSILLGGRADLIALARPHLADPFFTLHAAAAQEHPVPWPRQYAMGAPLPPAK